jgi:hypothetical protein
MNAVDAAAAVAAQTENIVVMECPVHRGDGLENGPITDQMICVSIPNDATKGTENNSIAADVTSGRGKLGQGSMASSC